MFLVTYDLVNNASIEDYKRVIDGIKSSYPNAEKLTESCWFIPNAPSLNAVLFSLGRFVRTSDRLLVAELKLHPAGKNLLSNVSPLNKLMLKSPRKPLQPKNPLGM